MGDAMENARESSLKNSIKNAGGSFNDMGIRVGSEPDWGRIRHLMKLGLAAAVIALAGDMVLGYGKAEGSVSGIPATFARYLDVSDVRLFMAAVLGLLGITLECLCYFAVYRLIAAGSERYAHRYRAGILGCLTFGACGVHVPCCGAVYFLKKIYGYSPDAALELTMKYIAYFLVPAMVLFLIFFFVMIVTQIGAFAKGLTPLPKWAWVFSVLFGLLAAGILKIPNASLTNALSTGWINLGNLWMFGGLLWITRKSGKL